MSVAYIRDVAQAQTLQDAQELAGIVCSRATRGAYPLEQETLDVLEALQRWQDASAQALDDAREELRDERNDRETAERALDIYETCVRAIKETLDEQTRRMRDLDSYDEAAYNAMISALDLLDDAQRLAAR